MVSSDCEGVGSLRSPVREWQEPQIQLFLPDHSTRHVVVPSLLHQGCSREGEVLIPL